MKLRLRLPWITPGRVGLMLTGVALLSLLLGLGIGVAAVFLCTGVLLAFSGAAQSEPQADLRQRCDGLEVMLASIGDAVIAADGEGRVTFLNPVAEMLTGWRLAEALGQPLTAVFRIVNERTRQPMESPAAQVLRDGTSAGLAHHTLLLTRDGQTRPIDDSGAPIRGSRGQVEGVVLVFRDISERRQAEVALQESERRYRLLFESNPHPMWVYDLDTLAILTVNEAASRHYGYSREEFLALTLRDLRPVEDVPALLADIAGSQNAARLHGGPWRHRKRDGTLIDVEITSHPLEFQGRRARFVLVTDITERLHAEEQLRQSEAQFRQVFNESPLGMALIGPDFRYAQVNPALCRLLEFTETELLARTSLDITDPEDRSLGIQEALEVFRGERTGIEVEKRYRTQAGDLRWVHVHSTLLRDAAGRPWRNLTLIENVTARRRAEAALAEADEVRRALVSASPLPIVALTAQGKVTFWNRAAEDVFGWQEAEVLGRELPFIPAEKREEHRGMRERDLAGQGFTGREIQRRRRDGACIDLSVSTAPMRDASGQVTGIMSIYVDITQRRQTEAALARQSEELTRSNQDLAQFAYAVSHDLQEPLRAVTSYAQLMVKRYKGALDADADVFLSYLAGGAERMRAMIHDLLAYSRVTSDETAPPAAVDLRAAVQDALLNLELAIEDQGADIEVGELPTVRGHRGQLSLLFQNLLSNGIKYRRPEERPRLIVRALRQAGRWEIAVQDNGMGIDPRHHERIFGIFRRLHGADVPGTGIGLALCRKIVDRHGGRIWVDSAGAGQGATFRFTLPEES